MSVILDQERCIRCKRCVADCSVGVFSVGSDGAIEINESLCFHCGHCYAVCPQRAIALDGIAPDALPSLVNLSLDESTRDMLFKARRSVRQFKQHPVDAALLQRALDLANYAPTARNMREVHWTVINGREKIVPLVHEVADTLRNSDSPYKRMVAAVEKGLDPIMRGAPCLVMAHAKPWVWAEVDCAAAISYLELALHSMGLGSCWCGIVISASKAQPLPSLPLPDGHVAYAGLMVGEPTVTYTALPPRSEPPVRYL